MAYDHEEGMDMDPHVAAKRKNSGSSINYQWQIMHPIYQNHHHESNHIQLNIFVHLHTMTNVDSSHYYWDERNSNEMLLKQMEEQKVK